MRWFRRAKQDEAPPPVLPEPELIRSRLQLACQLPALADARGLLERLADDYARTRALAERPLRIALVGSTGAGKSTLLNALAGTVLAREGVDRPTSSEAVAYAPSDADLGSLGAAVPRVVRYLTEAGTAWSGQVFVDTPGRTRPRRWRCWNRSMRRWWCSTAARWPRPGPARRSAPSRAAARCSGW